ncbi:MAG: Fe-S protein assembly co-chaperone HscB [Pigmentiphaga sp.]
MAERPDYFALLGVEPRFRQNRAELDEAWRRVQAAVHPDRYAAGSPQEKRVAMQWASEANEAYRTLKRPLSRARYLIEQAGVDLQVETNTAMAPTFLMQQMEWREALAEARAESDQQALLSLRQDLLDEKRACEQRAGHLLDELKQPAQAAAAVREWMFIEKFSDEVEASLDHLVGI